MTESLTIIRALLMRELQSFIHEIELLPDDESLWQTVPGILNPCGNLALHVAGNLQHYIGNRLGGTGYLRDRNREFSQRSGSREEVTAELSRAISTIDKVFPRLSAAMLDGKYPEAVGGVRPETGVFLFHLVSHTAFHLGQAGYLRRVLTGDPTSTNPVSPKGLADLPTG